MCYSNFDAGPGLLSPACSAPSNLLGFPSKSAKSFPCHTYEKRAHNSFICHTYKNKGLKVLYLPHLRKNPPPTPNSVNQELA